MDVLNELAAKAIDRLEKENLISFMQAFCGHLAHAGEEIPERDKPLQESFQKVYETALAVEEKIKALDASENAAIDQGEARKQIVELRSAVDKLQTLAHRHNPALASFARKVAMQAQKMAKPLEEFLEKPLESDLNRLYEQFKSLEEES